MLKKSQVAFWILPVEIINNEQNDFSSRGRQLARPAIALI
jgi:hypothetical protein